MTYFDFLLNLVDYQNKSEYRKLLMCLDSQEYIWRNDLDENRAWDGLDLRKLYLEQYNGPIPEKPCTILEMLIALSLRCEQDIMTDGIVNRTGEWFTIMIRHLGLIDQAGDNYSPVVTYNIIFQFQHGKVGKHGENSIVYVNNPKKPLYRVDLWTQLNWYLSEHYYFGI